MQEQPSPDPKSSVAALVARLQASFGLSDGVEGKEAAPLKYVIYARRSLEESSVKQERSIGDQIGECKSLADRLGLRWVDVIAEKKSAMVAEKRPLFRTMLDNIRLGKYGGIIAWAPDRLARNMKEAGEIIDMLDHGVIKDLKFGNNVIYNNDPQGKMMLGFAFITAKQYSDQHSQNVTRAIRRKTAEGKWAGSHLKHGYYKDAKHFLLPDGENHDLIREAFQMRLKGEQLNAIAAFLSSRGFPVKTAHTKHRDLRIDDKYVSGLLRDPFYAGAMMFGGQIENLLDKYDFVPAVSVEDFDQLSKGNKVKKGYKLSDLLKAQQGIKADLMRGMVTCGECGKLMSTGITKGLFYFRCDHKKDGCSMGGKSVRAKVIMDAAYAFLNKHPLTTKKGYAHYVAEMKKNIISKNKENDRDAKSLAVQKQHSDARVADMKELVRAAKGDKMLVKEYQDDMKKHLTKSKELAEKIKTLNAPRLNASDVVLAFEDFHELFQNLANYIQKVDAMSDLDYIMRKLFMNFSVKGKKGAYSVAITQNSPFRELCLVADSAMVTPRGVEPRLQA